MSDDATILMLRLQQEHRLSSGNYPRTRQVVGDAYNEIKRLRGIEHAAREFVKRHPALSLIDLAEFEAFLKMPQAIDEALK